MSEQQNGEKEIALEGDKTVETSNLEETRSAQKTESEVPNESSSLKPEAKELKTDETPAQTNRGETAERQNPTVEAKAVREAKAETQPAAKTEPQPPVAKPDHTEPTSSNSSSNSSTATSSALSKSASASSHSDQSDQSDEALFSPEAEAPDSTSLARHTIDSFFQKEPSAAPASKGSQPVPSNANSTPDSKCTQPTNSNANSTPTSTTSRPLSNSSSIQEPKGSQRLSTNSSSPFKGAQPLSDSTSIQEPNPQTSLSFLSFSADTESESESETETESDSDSDSTTESDSAAASRVASSADLDKPLVVPIADSNASLGGESIASASIPHRTASDRSVLVSQLSQMDGFSSDSSSEDEESQPTHVLREGEAEVRSTAMSSLRSLMQMNKAVTKTVQESEKQKQIQSSAHPSHVASRRVNALSQPQFLNPKQFLIDAVCQQSVMESYHFQNSRNIALSQTYSS